MINNKIWFTSDQHFYDPNICKNADRPFDSVEEMDEALEYNWNYKVRPGDIVYVLGDFARTNNSTDQPKVEKLLSRLNGCKQLIIGNHERKAVLRARGWDWVGHYKSIKIKDPDAAYGVQKIVMFHYAIRSWQAIGRGAWALYGHSHGNLEAQPGRCMDVGVDCHDLLPLEYNEIKSMIGSNPIWAEDHHKQTNEN